MRFIQTHSMGSDCTAPYDVKDYKAKTVREFIQEMLKERPNEWGKIQVKKMFGGGFCTYRNGRLLSDLRPEFLDLEIHEVKSAGGWGCMDYLIFTKDKESTMKRTEDGHFIDDPKPEKLTRFFVLRKGETQYKLLKEFKELIPNVSLSSFYNIDGEIFSFTCMNTHIDLVCGDIIQNVMLREE
jgi:hypothetical protein